MTDERYDVAIVGGSLAGSVAAAFFGRAGLRVALLERHTDRSAFKALCTTVIQPSAVPTIRRLGLDRSIETAGGIRSAIALWTRWGWIRDPDDARGYDIRRETLDPMIRELAATTPGVDYLPGHTLRSVLTDGGRVVGVGVDAAEGGPREIRARLVVGADGRSSEVAKLAGVGARVVRKHNRAGYFAYFRNVEVPFPEHAHLWMLEPDVAYAFPHDDGLSILAVMFTKERVPAFKKDVQGNFLAFLQAVPGFARFNPTDQVGKVLGLIDHPNLWRHRPPPGLAFVGDAAVSADPLFGVGCGWALQEAEWLADATVPALGSDRGLDAAVGKYCSTLRSKLWGHFFLISDYSTGRAFNPVEKLTFSAAAKDPQAAHLVAQFGARAIPARTLLTPRALAHAARVDLRHRGGSPQTKENLAMLRRRAAAGGFAGAAASTAHGGPSPEAADAVPVRAGTIKVAGLRSPLLEAGPPESDEAVVFVHGNPGSSEDWRALLGRVGAFARAVALDMPGFGGADKPKAGFAYTIEGYAAHLGAALAQLGIARAHLVLHDFGGPWGLAWAAANPGALGATVLIDTGVLTGYRWHYLAKIWRTPVGGDLFMASATRPAFGLLLRHGNRGGLPKAFVDRMYADFDRGTKRAVLRLYRATGDIDGWSSDVRASLAPLNAPALVVWGGRDPYVPAVQAYQQGETFAVKDVVVLPDSGHWPFVDDPDGVAAAVIPFLEQATVRVAQR